MNIDWSATGTWMQAWAGFAQAAAVVVATYFATNTFKSWRKQKLEERRIEAAEKVLTLAYRFRNAFSAIRSPLKSTAATDEATFHLIESGLDLETIPLPKRNKIVESQVILDRINGHSDLWSDFNTTLPIASALLGTEVEGALREIWRQKTAIQVAAEQYPDDDGTDPLFSEQIAFTVWEVRTPTLKGDDKVSAAIVTNVAELESRLFPIIRAD